MLAQDLVQTEQQCLTIWPTKSGWHQLTWSKNTELADHQNARQGALDSWLYAYTEQNWSVWQQTQNHHASQNIAQQHNTNLLEKQTTKSLDKIWFWGLLILSMSLLWLERKLF
jgi:hypothetical protein